MRLDVNTGRYGRSVSIIGVGCSPVGDVLTDPRTKDFTTQQLFAWAAHEAMQDAGLDGADIDALAVGVVGSSWWDNAIIPNAYLAKWIGMEGKPSVHHEEACATGYSILEQAVQAIASGQYNIVIAVGAEVNRSWLGPDWSAAQFPNHIRVPFTPGAQFPFKRPFPPAVFDPSYARWDGASTALNQDYEMIEYAHKYGVSLDQMTDALDELAIVSRRHSSMHPYAMYRTTFEEEAKSHGYNDVHEYLRNRTLNPLIGWITPKSGYCKLADGAGAVIFCASEIAHKFKQQPIEVLGIGSACFTCTTPDTVTHQAEWAFKRMYDASGIKPSEIDYFATTDMWIGEQITTAEEVGYLPKGEAWRYALEGRTAFDGDKPINTNGGAPGYGHFMAGAGPSHVCETVLQMRGQAGPRQIKKIPEVAVQRGEGGGQLTYALAFRTLQ